MNIDGEQKSIRMGSIVDVNKSFEIEPIENFRVNIIGYVQKGKKDESGVRIIEKRIKKRYSIDRDGKIFRVEFYKNNKFAGMVLVNFDKSRKLKKNLSIASQKAKSITSKL
jgi:hypothetical protein